MRLKKLGVMLLAVFALTAVVASAAQAAEWQLESGKSLAGESVNVEQTGTAEFTSKVLGQNLKLTSSATSVVEGKLTAGGGATGKLAFTGITVDEPAGCKSANITTNALVAQAAMGNTEATKEGVYVKFTPASGEVFANIKLEGCAAAGTYQAKGVVYALAANKTGVFAAKQGLSSSAAINSSQGGSLTLGKEAAVLTGTLDAFLTGANSGAAWALK